MGKLNDKCITPEENPYDLPEGTNFTFCELDMIDYIIGFQNEEMTFRNYLK